MKLRYRKSFVVYVVMTMSLLVLNGCGPGLGGDSACVPNVIDTGMSINISQLSTNVYSIQLCSNANPSNAVYSVYGGIDSSYVTEGNPNFNSAGAIRAGHIADADLAGSSFQVTFMASDNYFSIIEDTGNTLVIAHKLPGRP